MAKILIIEDDPDFAASIQLALKGQNHSIEHAKDGEDGLHRLHTYTYDLIICDWMLPSISGIEIIKEYRSSKGTTMILMLTGRSATGDIITGFDAGADDYLVKPFNIRELLARVNALLRRSVATETYDELSHGPIKYNPSTMTVTNNGTELKLSRKELQLLSLFLSNPTRIFSLENLLTAVWQDDPSASEDTVRTHIKTLRQKLQAGGDCEIISNVHGKGYRLSAI